MSYFALIQTSAGDHAARRACLTTAHGRIETPAFMPVGTQATVKAVAPDELKAMAAPIILGNTYHLHLRPGMEIIAAAGGLHRFMNWEGPILTDSGGYQVFSLAALNRVTDEGVAFRSHIDGSPLFLGPAEAMEIQRILGSDIAMAFDECPPYPCDRDRAAASLARTLTWARRCRDCAPAAGQLVFGIVQGAGYADLRQEAAEALVQMDFDGYAVGGVSVGEPEEKMYQAIEWAVPALPATRPRYLMGVGSPPQIVEAVARGIDMFDCVLPTRVGRNGSAYTRDGMLQMKAGRYKQDFSPIEEGCTCPACQSFSRAYIRHLLNVREILGLRLLTLHNLYFYLNLMREIRAALAAGTFDAFRRAFRARYRPPRKNTPATS